MLRNCSCFWAQVSLGDIQGTICSSRGHTRDKLIQDSASILVLALLLNSETSLMGFKEGTVGHYTLIRPYLYPNTYLLCFQTTFFQHTNYIYFSIVPGLYYLSSCFSIPKVQLKSNPDQNPGSRRLVREEIMTAWDGINYGFPDLQSWRPDSAVQLSLDFAPQPLFIRSLNHTKQYSEPQEWLQAVIRGPNVVLGI